MQAHLHWQTSFSLCLSAGKIRTLYRRIMSSTIVQSGNNLQPTIVTICYIVIEAKPLVTGAILPCAPWF
jgi:hypothetical protein